MRGGTVMTGAIAAAAMLSTVVQSQRMIVSGSATSVAEQQRVLKAAEEDAKRAHALSGEFEARAAHATVEADRLGAQAAALAARIQESEAQLRGQEARIEIIDHLIAAQSARLAGQQGPLVRLTAALQSLASRPPALALVQPGSLRDTVHVRAVFEQLLPVIRQRTAALRAALQRSHQLKALATQADRSLRSSKTKLAEQRVQLQRLEAQKRVAARGLASKATLEAERATAMGERARDIGDLMQELQTASDTRDRLEALAGPELRPSTPASAGAPVSGASEGPSRARPPAYRLPVLGSLVTGTGELSDNGVRARGISIATQPGAQVVAPAKGRIAFAGAYRGFGQIVILDHGDGWSSLVANLGRLSVDVGDRVDQGTPLGAAPSTANPVVTVELRRRGRPVDVVAIIDARS